MRAPTLAHVITEGTRALGQRAVVVLVAVRLLCVCAGVEGLLVLWWRACLSPTASALRQAVTAPLRSVAVVGTYCARAPR